MPANFTTQTDDGLTAGANAYCDVAFFRQYHLDRGRDTTATLDAAVQVGLVLATDYADQRWRLRFKGIELNDDQSTEWPRDEAYTDRGVQIVGIPTKLKQAVCEYALRAITDGELVQDAPGPIVDGEWVGAGRVVEEHTSVGPISTQKTFADQASPLASGTITTNQSQLPQIAAADMLIEYLLKNQALQRGVLRS